MWVFTSLSGEDSLNYILAFENETSGNIRTRQRIVKKKNKKKKVTKQKGQCKLYFVKMSNTCAMRHQLFKCWSNDDVFRWIIFLDCGEEFWHHMVVKQV